MKARNKDFKPTWCPIDIGTVLKYNHSKNKGIVVGYDYPFVTVLLMDCIAVEDVYELTHQFKIWKG